MPQCGGDKTDMNKIRILHTADLHLDSPFEALPGNKAAVRRAEQRRLLTSLTELARREEADMVLLSGDLLDSTGAYHETGEELVRSLGSISVPVFIAPGNHDFYSPKSPYARLELPDNVYIFKSPKIECIELPELSARVYGAAFTENRSGPMLQGFKAGKTEGCYNILCMHGEVGNPDSPYNPISEAQLADSGADYAALGHIHKASGLKKAGNTWYSWPGCPEGRGFDETGEKTVSMIELEGDRCSLSTFSIASRKYEVLDVDITDTDPLLAVNSSLPADTVRDVYRIILKGQTGGSPDLNELYEKLSGMFFELQLRDETRLRRSVWEKAGEDSLKGIFLAKLLERFKSAADDDERKKLEQAARWGLAALENGEEVIKHED